MDENETSELKIDPILSFMLYIQQNMKLTTTLSRLAAAAITQIKPLPSYESRKPDFALISQLPFSLPNTFNHESIIEYRDQPVGDAKYLKTSIGCADDIVYHATRLRSNMEVVAHGIQYSLPEALMEAARTTEAEDCKYIVIKTVGTTAVILENTTAPESKKTLVISPLEPRIAHLSKL